MPASEGPAFSCSHLFIIASVLPKKILASSYVFGEHQEELELVTKRKADLVTVKERLIECLLRVDGCLQGCLVKKLSFHTVKGTILSASYENDKMIVE